MSASRWASKVLLVTRWFVLWLLCAVAIILAGALAGAILYPIGGRVFGYQLGFNELLINGIKDGGFYAMIWAPGISFVLCLMGSRKNIQKIPIKISNPLDTQN